MIIHKPVLFDGLVFEIHEKIDYPLCFSTNKNNFTKIYAKFPEALSPLKTLLGLSSCVG